MPPSQPLRRGTLLEHQRAFSHAQELMNSHAFKWFCDVLDDERDRALNRVVDMTDHTDITNVLAEVRVYDKFPNLLASELSRHKNEIEAQGGRTDGR